MTISDDDLILERAGIPPPVPPKKQHRGFAAMSPETRQRISSLGGKAAHAKGTAYEFSSEEARVAGRKGGLALQKKNAEGPDTEPETTR